MSIKNLITKADFLDQIEQSTYSEAVLAIRRIYNSVLQETGDLKKAKYALSDVKKAVPWLFAAERKRRQ
jgi:hypothetical protein